MCLCVCASSFGWINVRTDTKRTRNGTNERTNERAENFWGFVTVNRAIFFSLHTPHPSCVGVHVVNVYSEEPTCGFKIVRALEHESSNSQTKTKKEEAKNKKQQKYSSGKIGNSWRQKRKENRKNSSIVQLHLAENEKYSHFRSLANK